MSDQEMVVAACAYSDQRPALTRFVLITLNPEYIAWLRDVRWLVEELNKTQAHLHSFMFYDRSARIGCIHPTDDETQLKLDVMASNGRPIRLKACPPFNVDRVMEKVHVRVQGVAWSVVDREGEWTANITWPRLDAIVGTP